MVSVVSWRSLAAIPTLPGSLLARLLNPPLGHPKRLSSLKGVKGVKG
jgi:hypothetical protein